MNLLRSITVATALMLPLGLAQATTSNTPSLTLANSHPSFSVTEDRVLNLRETGSKIVIQTIENALRQGGLALLGEGFQLDSSLSYHSGDNKGIEGDLDVVVPLWKQGRHVIFTQPGFVFWTGHAEEERIDGNIGLVYRAELTRDLVAGASVFYDQDFQIGHSRVGGGVDLQSGFFRFGANYYHVLSEIEDGREGFVEEAVDGMDARFVFEREDVRLGSTVGYWDYDGGEDVEDERKISIGVDFGFRVLPGVFIEGSWERHKDNLVLDERIFAGLAFRFSLPDFEGGSYAGGEMSSDLYRIVEREKRILYEEREANSPVDLRPVDENRNPLTQTPTFQEDSTVTIAGDLEALPVAAMLELAIDEDASSADLGTDFSYGHKVYVLDEATGQQSEPDTVTNCPEATCEMMIPAGVTMFDVEIKILDDSVAKEIPEEIVLRVNVPAEHQNAIRSGETTVTIRAHGNTVAFAAATSDLDEDGGTVEVSVSVDLPSPTPITLNVETGGTATEGTDYRISTTSLVIPANASSASLTLQGIDDNTGEGSETIVLTLSDPNDNLPEGWEITNEEHMVDLQDDDLSIFLENAPSTLSEPADGAGDASHMITVRITQPPEADIEVMIAAGGTGETASSGNDYLLNPVSRTFNATNLMRTFSIAILEDSVAESDETIVVTLTDVGGSLASEGSGFSLAGPYTITIPANDNTVGFASDATATLDESGGTASVEVSTTNAASVPITLNVETGGTATEGTDYRNLPASVTISAGQTSGTITLTGIEDQVIEEDETIVLMLSAGSVPTGWALGTAVMHTVTISDDPPPNISFSSESTGEIDGGMAGTSRTNINLVITPASTSAITIPLTFTGDHVPIRDEVTVSGGTATLTGKPSDDNVMINVPANLGTVTLTVVSGEDCDRDTDDVSFSLGTLPAGYVAGSPSSWRIRIHDGGAAGC